VSGHPRHLQRLLHWVALKAHIAVQVPKMTGGGHKGCLKLRGKTWGARPINFVSLKKPCWSPPTEQIAV